jgi:hypothetical protein
MITFFACFWRAFFYEACAFIFLFFFFFVQITFTDKLNGLALLISIAEKGYAESDQRIGRACEDRNKPLEWLLSQEPKAKELLDSLELSSIVVAAADGKLKDSTKNWRRWFEWISPLAEDEQLAWRSLIWLNDWSGQPLKVTSFLNVDDFFPELGCALKNLPKITPPTGTVPDLKWVMQLSVIMLAASIASQLPLPRQTVQADIADLNAEKKLKALRAVCNLFQLVFVLIL